MNQALEEVLFHAALEKQKADRAVFLDAVCEGDPGLRRNLEELLEAHDAPNALLGTAVVSSAARNGAAAACSNATRPWVSSEQPNQATGHTIGRYKLREQVGEGGWGVVYVAEQTEPVRRRVALKVIKPGMDTKAVVARFEAERQALALMDHPNIAKVLDAGTIDHRSAMIDPGSQLPLAAGRPFFVMELVRGIPITTYCDQERLNLRERLDLFIRVCQAIQHAHQKGIIHRDIKPANVLVTLHDGVPVPKVIDFGIAKAIEGRLTDATVYTHLNQFLGTPAYMSPEQAEMSGLDIDTRTDIYSLGVLLYELLTGKTPFETKDLLSQGIDALRQTIREAEPIPPSTRLVQENKTQSTTSALRPPRTRIPEDLDWIVLKCLEKDRRRRYETANGLATDLRRHLEHEPVVARPPSTTYRLHMTVRRHKVLFTAGVLLMASLATGIGLTSWQAFRAQSMKAHYQAALHFIQDFLRLASPGFQPDRELKVSDLLQHIPKQLEGPPRQPPLVEAFIRQVLGSIHTELGNYAEAIEHYRRAHQLQTDRLGKHHAETLRSLHGLAMAHWWGGDMAKAKPLTQEGLEASRRRFGRTHLLTLQFTQANSFTAMAMADAPWAEIESLLTEAYDLHSRVLGPEDHRTLRQAYIRALAHAGRFEGHQAIPGLEGAVELASQTLGREHPLRLSLMALLAHGYLCDQRFEDARRLAAEVGTLREGTLGARHPLTLTSVVLQAHVEVAQQRLDIARAYAEKALESSMLIPVENSPFLAWQMAELGWAYLEQGALSEADSFMQRALEAMALWNDANPLAALGIRTQAGALHLARNRNAEAAQLLRDAHHQATNCWAGSAYLHYFTSLLGESLYRQSDYAAAERLLRQGLHGLHLDQARMPPLLDPQRRIRESREWLAKLRPMRSTPEPSVP